MDKQYNKILQELLKEIPNQKHNKLFGITFIAPPGSGKSTISKLLSKRLDLYISSNDQIRRFLDNVGIDGENELSKKLAYDRSVYLLENKISMILDANMEFYYKECIENFKKHNAKVFFIEIQCSENEIINRINKRKLQYDESNTNYSKADLSDYYKYLQKKKGYRYPEEIVFFTVNSEEQIEEQIDILIKKIEREINGEL